MSAILPPKKDVALALLERAWVFVHLDPRAENVAVPPWLKKQPQLVLQIGLNMAVKIPDLEVGDQAISCTLSFSRMPHFCYVPWEAVYALVGEDGRGMVWPEDIPPEVASQSPAPARKTPGLRSVPPPPMTADVAPGATQKTANSIPAPAFAAAELEDEDNSEELEDSFPLAGKTSPALQSVPPPRQSTPPTAQPEPSPRPSRAGGAIRPGSSGRSPSERPYLKLVK